MSTVLVDNLNIRTQPSTGAQALGDKYNRGEKISTGDLLISNEGRIWLRYTNKAGQKRYVCAYDSNGSIFVQVPAHIPGPRPPQAIAQNQNGNNPTGVPGIPKQKQFPENCIKSSGCCFLCTCVKGGLTNFNQCMDCFRWGINSGKLRGSDCYVLADKENWAREISARYGTQYHGDYCFQSNVHHFWLTQNGKEIFNSGGIGWRG